MSHALLLTLSEADNYGISQDFLTDFETNNPGVIAVKLQGVTDEMLGLFKTFAGAVLPLTAWGSVTKQKVADLLVYELKSYTGLAPAEGASGDANVIARAEAAREWGKSAAMQDPEVVDSSDDGEPGTVIVATSDDQREW